MLPSKILQTDFTPGKGNALQACVASILGHELEKVPNFVTFSDYNQAIKDYVNPKIVTKILLEIQSKLIFDHVGKFCILRGKSPRGDHGHVVIAKMQETGFLMEWDPHPDSTFLDINQEFGWCLFID